MYVAPRDMTSRLHGLLDTSVRGTCGLGRTLAARWEATQPLQPSSKSACWTVSPKASTHVAPSQWDTECGWDLIRPQAWSQRLVRHN
jgi:hypothetical protein